MKIILLLITLFTITTSTYSQLYYSTNRLRVQDPLQWSDEQGSIDEATLSIKPRGLYLEYGLYLTFSAKNTYLYNSPNNLEVRYNFELPEGAMVTDSWLWVENTIMQAKIMDRDKASTIYEGFVERRKDPSLLLKTGKNTYQLLVYPMLAKEVRKVKITYLLPMNWQRTNAVATLPLALLATSLNPLASLSLMAYTNNEFVKPTLSGRPEVAFVVSDTNPHLYVGKIPFASFSKGVVINYCMINKCNQNVFFKYFQDAQSDIYYQLSINPSEIAPSDNNKKIVFLIDHDVVNSSTLLTTMLDNVKNYLNNHLSSKDSFNLIFSKIIPNRVSEKWLPMEAATVENAFNNFGDNFIAGYSNVGAVLNNGIDFVKENGSVGNLILVSNTVGTQSTQEADKLLSTLKDKLIPGLKIFCNNNYSQYNNLYTFNDKSVKANNYFYSNLCQMTGGKMLDHNLFNLDDKISNFEVYSTVNKGYLYDKLDNLKGKNHIHANQTYLQTGKFVGDFPIELNISGIQNTGYFSQKISINNCTSNTGDVSIKTVAIGNQIADMERDNTGEMAAKILELSMSNRILSTQTALLALEPSQSNLGCSMCVDETPAMPVNRQPPPSGTANQNLNFASFSNVWDYRSYDTLKVVMFPNPLIEDAHIFITMPEGRTVQGSTLQISDLAGIVIKKFDLSLHASLKQARFIWNGLNDAGNPLPNGLYLLTFKSPEKTVMKKINILK